MGAASLIQNQTKPMQRNELKVEEKKTLVKPDDKKIEISEEQREKLIRVAAIFLGTKAVQRYSKNQIQ
jgi:hypothetical protein